MKDILKMLGTLIVAVGGGAIILRVGLKWMEWCGWGKGFPKEEKIQTLFEEKK